MGHQSVVSSIVLSQMAFPQPFYPLCTSVHIRDGCFIFGSSCAYSILWVNRRVKPALDSKVICQSEVAVLHSIFYFFFFFCFSLISEWFLRLNKWCMYYTDIANACFILCLTLFLKAQFCFGEELLNIVTFPGAYLF